MRNNLFLGSLGVGMMLSAVFYGAFGPGIAMPGLAILIVGIVLFAARTIEEAD